LAQVHKFFACSPLQSFHLPLLPALGAMARVFSIVIVLALAGNNAIRVDDVEQHKQEPEQPGAAQQQVQQQQQQQDMSPVQDENIVADAAAEADGQKLAKTAKLTAWKAGKEKEIAEYNAATAAAKDQSASDVQAKLQDVYQIAANDVTALKAREEKFGTLTKESGEAFRAACTARKEAHEVIPAAETEALDCKDKIIGEEHQYVDRKMEVVDAESELKWKHHFVGLTTAAVGNRTKEHKMSEVDKAIADKFAKQINEEEAKAKQQMIDAMRVKQQADDVLLAKNAAFDSAQHTFQGFSEELLAAEKEQKAVDKQVQEYFESMNANA